MNLDADKINIAIADDVEYVLEPRQGVAYVDNIEFRELTTKKLLSRTCVALIGSALIALSHLPIKKKERPPAEIKPSQINSHIQNPYKHKTFPVICLGDLTEQLRNKNEKG